jgi:hypothetical protein
VGKYQKGKKQIANPLVICQITVHKKVLDSIVMTINKINSRKLGRPRRAPPGAFTLNPIFSLAYRRIVFHHQPERTSPPRRYHIAFLVADYPVLRRDYAVTTNGFFQHQDSQLAAQTTAVIGMMWARAERIDPEAM